METQWNFRGNFLENLRKILRDQIILEKNCRGTLKKFGTLLKVCLGKLHSLIRHCFSDFENFFQHRILYLSIPTSKIFFQHQILYRSIPTWKIFSSTKFFILIFQLKKISPAPICFYYFFKSKNFFQHYIFYTTFSN